MSVCKVLEIILRGLGHFAAIKCPYKWQRIGSNVWFLIFLSICVSPVIRVPKCSAHRSAQSDFSIETERRGDTLQIAKWKRPSNSLYLLFGHLCWFMRPTMTSLTFFLKGVDSSFSPLRVCVRARPCSSASLYYWKPHQQHIFIEHLLCVDTNSEIPLPDLSSIIWGLSCSFIHLTNNYWAHPRNQALY